MNGQHDMGGMQCYGPVLPEADEPIFHGEWEKKALAMTVALGFTGSWNLDVSRFARESIPPSDYISLTYYEIWLAGIQRLMLERGMVNEGELTTGKMDLPPKQIKRLVQAKDVPEVLAKGGPVDREPDCKPRFSVGDKIKTIKTNPTSHTRLPRYARNACGVIESVCGFHVFPDSNAKGKGENPHWLYTVCFSASELFGETSNSNHQVHLDLWEPYLERQ